MRFLLSFMLLIATVVASAGDVTYTTNDRTGALNSIAITGQTDNTMNWLMKTDGSQYVWVKDNYGWGLGYMTVNGKRTAWATPYATSAKGTVRYKAGDIDITVVRTLKKGELTETYTFTNTGKTQARLTNIGIYTPFNDNYPDSKTCMTARCNTHIWAGGSAAYVEAQRMDGHGEGIALMTVRGSVSDYDIWERDRTKGGSNSRGVIALAPADTVLKQGAKMVLEWRIFTYSDHEDFVNKMLSNGGAMAVADKYVYEKGETAIVRLVSAKGTIQTKHVSMQKPGEQRVTLNYAKGKQTWADLLCVSSVENLISKRIDFIMDHQQMNNPSDPRYGAYMVYDCDGDSIYLNTDARRSSDTNDGRERLGMGVLLAEWQKTHPSQKIMRSLEKYADFVRTRLQDTDFTTFSSYKREKKIRGYNYPWVADFYFRMYDITRDKKYAEYGYRTMRAFFRRFGYGFYAIGMPVTQSLRVLQETNMTEQRDTLLADYCKTADVFVKNGLNFPGHEVNYEQSIIAPAVQFLCEAYLATKQQRYLEGVRTMLPALEGFAGHQPSHHLNGIAIRHWDGYWFGKKQTFGDTFPHYWSTENASTYYYYALCTGDTSYRKRAMETVMGNLSLFAEDGKASCAFLYPRMINGEKAHYYDAFANDQDWALVQLLLVNGE